MAETDADAGAELDLHTAMLHSRACDDVTRRWPRATTTSAQVSFRRHHRLASGLANERDFARSDAIREDRGRFFPR